MTRNAFNGKLADPEFRRERARNAGKSRTSIDYHIKKIVDAAPELTDSQRAELAPILRPAS